METSIIEKYDKRRYTQIKWSTIGWALWFGAYILKDLSHHPIIIALTFVLVCIGFLLFIQNMFRFLRLGKEINANENLKNALQDEYLIHNRNKAFRIAYLTTLITIGIFFAITNFYKISGLVVSELTLFIGILSGLVAMLILQRG